MKEWTSDTCKLLGEVQKHRVMWKNPGQTTMKAAHGQTLTYMTLWHRHNCRDRNQVTSGQEVEKGDQLQRGLSWSWCGSPILFVRIYKTTHFFLCAQKPQKQGLGGLFFLKSLEEGPSWPPPVSGGCRVPRLMAVSLWALVHPLLSFLDSDPPASPVTGLCDLGPLDGPGWPPQLKILHHSCKHSSAM